VKKKTKVESRQAKNWLVIAVLLLFFLSVQSQKSPTPQNSQPQKSPITQNTPSPNEGADEPLPAIPVAQNTHQWEQLTLFNGLPSQNVNAIAQTLDGVLWFGTESGLSRFDGRRLQTIPLENKTFNKILALKTANDGTLWIGTEKGAFLLKDGKVKAVAVTKDFAITSILLAENIFLATADGLILELLEKENSFEKNRTHKTTEDYKKPLLITSLAKIGQKIIAGTQSRGLLVIENDQIRPIKSEPYFVNVLASDSEDNLWLGAGGEQKGIPNGLFRMNNNSPDIRKVENPGNVLAIAPNDKGEVWVGTQKNGLYRFRGEGQLEQFNPVNTTGGLCSDKIKTFLVDREEVLWIGTDRGVCRYDAASPFNQAFSNNKDGKYVRTIYQSATGKVFVGTNNGLFSVEGEEVTGLSKKPVYAIGEDFQNQLLIGTPNGLFSFGGKQLLKGEIRAISNFQAKTYLAVFGRGLVENANLVFAHDSLITLLPNSGKLWLGTARAGVFFFDGKEVKRDPALEQLNTATVRKIVKGVDGDLWFAADTGLFRYHNGKLENVIEGRDLRDTVIIGSEVWAASENDGIFHARWDDLFGWIRTNLNTEQGLSSEKTFALLGIENRLLIGTSRSLVNYVPSKIPPKVVITQVLSKRLHESAELADTIALEYPQNSLLVEAAGLSSRTFPEQFQYGFLLKNAKGEILKQKFSNDSQFAPTDLEAGEYIIDVRAFNKDLLSSEPLIIRFSVARAPFPWTATALGGLLIIALSGLIWAIIERRRIVQKNRELAIAKFDLANEAERERKRIARDLHDQTLADLRNLMLMSDKLPSDNSEFRTEIESVSTEIRRICEALSPSVLENVGLTAALEFLLQHTIENYKFLASEDIEEHLNFSPNVQMQIYRIAQEVLTNIKHHSDAKLVEMKVDLSEEVFILSISDDGTPFSPTTDTAHKGRGIANIKSRAALIEAEVDWLQNESHGTEFSLRLWNSTAVKPQ